MGRLESGWVEWSADLKAMEAHGVRPFLLFVPFALIRAIRDLTTEITESTEKTGSRGTGNRNKLSKAFILLLPLRQW